MSKKRTENKNHKQKVKQEKSDAISEEALDFIVRAMLTPKTISLLLQDKSFVRKALSETIKAKSDKDDMKGLGEKYSVSSESIEQNLKAVEDIFTKILGDQQE